MERVMERVLVLVDYDKSSVVPSSLDSCDPQQEFLQTMFGYIETKNIQGIQEYVGELLNLAEFVEVNPVLAVKYYDRVITARIIMNQLRGR